MTVDEKEAAALRLLAEVSEERYGPGAARVVRAEYIAPGGRLLGFADASPAPFTRPNDASELPSPLVVAAG